MDRLLTRLSKCTCRVSDPHIQELHLIGRQKIPALLARSCSNIGDHSSDSLSATTAGPGFPIDVLVLFVQILPEAGVKTVAKGSKNWPSSPTELVPLGGDAFVAAMLHWHSVLQDSVAFAMCGVTLRICRLILLPSLVSHSVCEHFVEAGRALYDRYMIYLTSEDSSPAALRAAYVFQTQLEGLQTYIKEVMLQDADWKTLLVRGYETKLVQVSTLLVHITTDPRYPRAHQSNGLFHTMVSVGPIFYRFFHMHLPPRPAIPLHPLMVQLDQRVFPPPASIRSLPNTAVSTIHAYKLEGRCSGLGCPHSIQSVGKNFQRCARCNTIAYCSRECQTQDWRCEKFPHKLICPIIRNLVAQGGGWTLFSENWYQETPTILRNWAAAGVRETDLEYLDDWRKDRESRRSSFPDGSEWTPGYDDYNDIVWQFGASGRGPKPQFPNRLARWPSEVAKVKTLLEALPFWEADIA